jgi:hypothetical protein
MTLAPDSVLRRRPDIRFRRVGHEWVVIRQDSAEVLVLNEWAGSVLELIDGSKSLHEIAGALEARYEGDGHSIHVDVIAFASDLESQGLCETSGGSDLR